MKQFNLPQRTPAWLRKRVGKATASEFKRIVTPTGQLSKQSSGYRDWLLTEMMLGRPIETERTQYMVRGMLLEDQAVEDFELIEDVETEPGGFITNDAETIGVSPDRLIGANGILEIKCPAAWTHMGYLVERTVDGHKPQIQGQLWVAERDYVSILSYHPEMPKITTNYGRDEKYIALLKRSIEAFVADLLEKRIELEGRYGEFPDVEALPEENFKEFISLQDGEDIITDYRQRGVFDGTAR